MTEGIFSRFERDELNKITAKSILEKLMNIRQNINVEFTARRLIWELMQNAKDNASLCNEEGEKVDVTIQITENEFIFTHNKGYFTNEHIRGLIRKYSSSDKDRDTEHIGKAYKTTGRFGTGFMTTHILSEKVQVKSYYKNEDQTFNQFSFWLDRSGKGEKDIIQGINNAFEEAEANIKKTESIYLTRNEFTTSFIYPLSEQKRKLAFIAIDEVIRGIAYTLIDVHEISSVTIDQGSKGASTYKVVLKDTIQYLGKDYLLYNLLIDGKESTNYYLALSDSEIYVIIPVLWKDKEYYALELDSTIPRLHLDFPMIGTEDLNLPFIVNSPLFEPTEPRDGISLIDDEENEFSQLNCNALLRAVNLYNHFLSYVGNSSNWNDLYNIARIKQPKKHTWIDEDWFKKEIISPIRAKLLCTPIVDVENGGRISIWNEYDECQVYFPDSIKEEIRNKIWELSKTMYPQFTPIKEHIHQWASIIWKDCFKFSISELSREIESKKNLSDLAIFLKGEEKSAIDFLNEYYNLLNIEGEHIKDIYNDKYGVIPNQLGEFKKRSELYIDENIDDEIKTACSLISTDPKSYLKHNKTNTTNKTDIESSELRYYVKKQENIISEINSCIKENINKSSISSVCDYLASLFPHDNIPEKRIEIFNFSQRIYPADFTVKRVLFHFDEKIWEESDKSSLFYIVSKIAGYKTSENASNELNFENKSTFINWLASFISFLVKEGFDNNINRINFPILPNQNGVFCIKDNLFLDDGSIDYSLKEISQELGHDFKDELLDISIYLELPENRIYTIDDVSEKISSSMKPIIRDVDRRKEYKETLKKFYLWMDVNRKKAEKYFSDLFENRFLFLEDEDISQNMKKATELDQLMVEHGIKTIEELRLELSKINKDANGIDEVKVTEKIDITKEILVSLGISSREELEEAFKNPEIYSRFYHTSISTTDMFIYAQGLIERAKQNIIEHLRNHSDYDCTDMEETAPTTLVGILKNGVSIQIVTRPSDNGEVIIYYSSEKDTLDSDNAELWVDNGIDNPHILTLGRILKSTGINRIPINMN